MSQDQTTISCPNCGNQIDVNDILYHQVDEQLKKKYQAELKLEQDKLGTQNAALEKEKQALKEQQSKQEELVSKQVQQALKDKESALTAKIKLQAAEEQKDAMQTLRTELQEKSSQVKKLNQTTAQLEALKREKDELEDKYKAEAARALSEKLASERERIQRDEAEKNELKFLELQKQLEEQKRLTEEMKRKQEQGSMQSQGEVQELAIEEWLGSQFPLDSIEEIKKGERGADCLQIVHTRSRQNCGSIYYESKRTKNFQPAWIEKFKQDIRDRNANIGVLVTEVMPQDMPRLGLRDGIWICSFEEFKGLCTVLRESIVQISTAIVSQENKGDKMGMLYDFLTSNEFQLQIEGIVEGFTQMKSDLDSEQRAMRSIWKKREKQIEKVLLNTTGMYGSIRGIAGSAVGAIESLELGLPDQVDLLENDS
ncbi:MAG: hypothetical protein ACI8P9_001726 [Parasphingorhabdus sp.]|jgi:hypothetical protein